MSDGHNSRGRARVRAPNQGPLRQRFPTPRVLLHQPGVRGEVSWSTMTLQVGVRVPDHRVQHPRLPQLHYEGGGWQDPGAEPLPFWGQHQPQQHQPQQQQLPQQQQQLPQQLPQQVIPQELYNPNPEVIDLDSTVDVSDSDSQGSSIYLSSN